MEIIVDNIKCDGCASTITKKLNAEFNTDSTDVNIEQGTVNLNLDDNKCDELAKVLLGLGYPEIDSVQGLNSAKVKVKSFVSCAIGKMDK